MSECDSYTDYHDYRIERAVILGFSTHTRNLFSEMRKYAANFEGTAYLAENEKERIYDLEKFIKRYTHTAGDEANIYLKAPLKESAAKQPTTFADLSTLNLETVEYSEKVIGVFGDTKLIKDVLKGLNDLFSVRTSSITVKGVRDGYTAGSRKYVRHSQCMPMHRDEKGRAVCSTLPIKINSININPLKFIVMKTNKNARKNNKVQKLEKETAVKVTALAIIPKPMILL